MGTKIYEYVNKYINDYLNKYNLFLLSEHETIGICKYKYTNPTTPLAVGMLESFVIPLLFIRSHHPFSYYR